MNDASYKRLLTHRRIIKDVLIEHQSSVDYSMPLRFLHLHQPAVPAAVLRPPVAQGRHRRPGAARDAVQRRHPGCTCLRPLLRFRT